MKYFGTDGVRGVVGKDLSERLIVKLARAVVRFLSIHNKKKIVLIGNDSRISSDYILTVFSSVLLSHGVEVHNIGVCSSPCLAYLTKRYSYSLGVMISASHNPCEYNGIKFFNEFGEKISDSDEAELETLISSRRAIKKSYACFKEVHSLKDSYVTQLRDLKTNDLPCVFDCACGGASKIVHKVFPHANLIFAKPNGVNINKNCGCLHLDMLKKFCLQNHLIGFALDGDADRLNIISQSGKIIKGDEILFILANHYLSAGNKVVGTIYSNSAPEKYFKKKKIDFVRAGVGDKLVYQKMREVGSTLGGENAGHVIVKPYSNTGDGLLNAILILNILSRCNCTIEKLLEDYHPLPQFERAIPKPDAIDKEEIKMLIRKYELDGARVIIRPSGTEPVLRIMVEHENEKIAENILKSIENCLKFPNFS